MNVVDERFVALVGTDLLVHPARCGHTRAFGLTPAGRKTLRPALHADPLAAAAAIWPANPGPLALPTRHRPPYRFASRSQHRAIRWTVALAGMNISHGPDINTH